MNFLIDLPFTYSELYNGGVIVLHKLAYELASRGKNVYIFCEPQYPHKNIFTIPYLGEKKYDWNLNKGWEEFNLDNDNTIAIYPEIRKGNPFNCKHVVRWLLNSVKYDTEKTYGENDYIFSYSINYDTKKNKLDGQLTTQEGNTKNFYVTNKGKREGYCHILHKSTPKNHKDITSQYKSKDLTDWKRKGLFKYLREEFNKHEFFITFDDKTYYSIAAALCGCKVIIIPTELTKKFYKNGTDFRMKNPLQMVGISYGFDDIEWTENTLHMVKKFIKDVTLIEDRTIDEFIVFCEKNIINENNK